MKKKWVFLGREELAAVRQLRTEGNLDKAEQILHAGEPSEAVLDELRKVASARARDCRRTGDWEGVIRHLGNYTEYAQEWRAYCIEMVSAEPPAHTKQDLKLLEEARIKLLSQST